jgi:hypothetical protein
MGVRVVGLAVLVACAAVAQGQAAATQESQPATQESQSAALMQAGLRQLAATAQSLQHDLPSFTCNESGLSQAIKKKKVKAQTRFAGELRVQRGQDGRLHERLDVTEVNGKPYRGGRFEPPFMVEGGFDQSLDYFLPGRQACFRFSGDRGRIDFESAPGTMDRPGCAEAGAPRGFALLDEAGNVTHVERQVPPELARQAHIVDFSSVDFVATELGGKMYPLSAKVVAEVAKDGQTLHFEAAYTGCHLFKATSTILPDVTPVPEGGPAPPHP